MIKKETYIEPEEIKAEIKTQPRRISKNQIN